MLKTLWIAGALKLASITITLWPALFDRKLARLAIMVVDPSKGPYPRILPIYRFLSISGNAIKIASAAPSPYGNGSIICRPMLTAKLAKRNIKYVL
jgi:hypothetical protein